MLLFNEIILSPNAVEITSLFKMLSQVTFEQIKDNFWYGLYGEFRVIIDKSDGYVNATKLCSSGGKQFYQWTRNEASQRLKKALEGDMVLDNTPDEENALQSQSQ